MPIKIVPHYPLSRRLSGSRAGLDAFEERSHWPMPVIQEQFVGCPVNILGTILYYVIYI